MPWYKKDGNKKMLEIGFHRLRYDEMQELAREFGVHNIGCGYMREPCYHSGKREVRGSCYLKKSLGEINSCAMHVPFKLEDCEYYQLWLKQKRGSNENT